MTMLSSLKCAWGSEQCAQIAENESGWFLYMLANHPVALAVGFLTLFVLWTLPAAGWQLLAELWRAGNRSLPSVGYHDRHGR